MGRESEISPAPFLEGLAVLPRIPRTAEGAGQGGAGRVGSATQFDWDRVVLEPIEQFDRSRIDPVLGVTVAVAIALPVALAVTTDLTAAAVIFALGAFNVFLGTGGLPSRNRARSAGLSWGLNAAGLGLGTLVSTLGFAQLPAIALGIAAFSSARLLSFGRWPAITSAGLFAIGVGLPNASIPIAGDRFLLALLGGIWALALGAAIAWARPRVSRPPTTQLPAPPPAGLSFSSVLVAAAATGIASALSYAAANALGLPHDYWTMLTVVVVFQTGILAAISSSVVRVVGTTVGALVGGALAAILVGPVGLTVVVAALAGVTMAIRPASPSVYVALLTPFVIVLLSISFPSGWTLAEGRVLDTLVGSGFALAATAVLWLTTREVHRGTPSAGAPG